MYDTIKIWIHTNEDISRYLENPHERIDMVTGEISFYGKINNLRIRQTSQRISLEGSLAVFYFHQNYDTLTLSSTESAINEVCDLLHLSIKEAPVVRIDFGTNILLNRPLLNYFDCLGELPRFKKSEMCDRETISYKNSQLELIFYNKIKELKKNKISISDHLIGKNLLRYEIRLTKNLSKQLHRPKIIVSDLYNINFFSTMIDYWEKRYLSIHKILQLNRTGKLSFVDMTSFRDSLALIGLLSLENTCTVEQELQNQMVGKSTKFKIRKYVKEIRDSADSENIEQAITELDEKVRQTAEIYRIQNEI